MELESRNLSNSSTSGLSTLSSEDDQKQYDDVQHTHSVSFLLGCPKPHPPRYFRTLANIIRSCGMIIPKLLTYQTGDFQPG